jgi:hypothetical protein
MSFMSDIHAIVTEHVEKGTHFDDIVELLVAAYGIPYDDAEQIVYDVEAQVTMDQEVQYHDMMDGDHASALASAGFGTDEDYGHFDDYNYDYE